MGETLLQQLLLKNWRVRYVDVYLSTASVLVGNTNCQDLLVNSMEYHGIINWFCSGVHSLVY